MFVVDNLGGAKVEPFVKDHYSKDTQIITGISISYKSTIHRHQIY